MQGFGKLAAGSLLAMTVMLAPLAALAVDDRVERETVVTRGQENGQSGYWVNVKERVYAWTSVYEVYRTVFGKVTITEKQAAVLQAQVAAGKLTYDGLATKLKAIKSDLEASAYIDNNDVTQTAKKTARNALEAAFNFDYEAGSASYMGDLSGNNETSTLMLAYRFLRIADALKAGLYDFKVSGFELKGQHSLNLSSSYQDEFETYVDEILNGGGTHTGSRTSSNSFKITDLTTEKAYQIAKDLALLASRTNSPIALDLNHDGKIGVTGSSSAKVRNYKNAFVSQGAVRFDLTGTGKERRYEWLNGDGDGFLVDDRDGKVSAAARGDGRISGLQLFGDAGGFQNGFQKLAKNFDKESRLATTNGVLAPGVGILKGEELQGLKVWVDRNCDARVQPAELRTLEELGISEIGSRYHLKKNPDGEILIQSYYFVQHGQRQLTEDVWFAVDPADRD